MPLYETMDELTTDWYDDDDEHIECGHWANDLAVDDLAGMHLRAQEAWPSGAVVRDGFPWAESQGWVSHEDAPTHFDD